MTEVMENKFIFKNKQDFVFCYNCRTEMSFDGYGYECPRCGSIYRKKKEVKDMKRIRCLRCGLNITKSSHNDPYLCRRCEREMEPEERFAHLDE